MPRPTATPRPARRRRWWLAALLALAGCQASPKEPAAAGRGADPFWSDPAPKPGAAPVSRQPAAFSGGDPDVSGILAGRLVDQFNRPATVGSIRVEQMGASAGAPQEIEIDPANQGHFYIRGLQPGRAYRLTARARQGDRTIAGEVIAKPPDAKLLIPLSEDFAGSAPPLPGPIAPPTWAPPAGAPAAELGAPVVDPERVAEVPAAPPPRANVPPPGLPAVSAPPVPAVPPSNATAPACFVSGNRIITLTLADPDGQVWDWSQRRGKLVLIDLWGSWCQPCLRAIPDLVQLQQTYRDRGLEVLGIACENGTAGQNVKRVNHIRKQIPSINYRVLMAGEMDNDPVRQQLRPASYPTLLLVDGDGSVIWRGGATQFRELENVLRQRLGG